MQLVKRALKDGAILLALVVLYFYLSFYVGREFGKAPINQIHALIEPGMGEADVRTIVNEHPEARILDTSSTQIEFMTETREGFFGYWACRSTVSLENGQVSGVSLETCQH